MIDLKNLPSAVAQRLASIELERRGGLLVAEVKSDDNESCGVFIKQIINVGMTDELSNEWNRLMIEGGFEIPSYPDNPPIEEAKNYVEPRLNIWLESKGLATSKWAYSAAMMHAII